MTIILYVIYPKNNLQFNKEFVWILRKYLAIVNYIAGQIYPVITASDFANKLFIDFFGVNP